MPGPVAPGSPQRPVIFTDGRELAGTLHFSVGTRLAAGPGAAREPSTVDAATDADAAEKADAAGNAEDQQARAWVLSG